MQVFSCTIDGADVRVLVYNPPSVKAHHEVHKGCTQGADQYLAKNSHIVNIRCPGQAPLQFLSSGVT